MRPILIALFLTSGQALLLKVFGIAEMSVTVPFSVLPCFIIALWWCQRSVEIKKDVIAGAVGGLLGTFAYDLARVPFAMMGRQIFVPIRVYGVWICDADNSNWLTDAVGWLYHFHNGICFGIVFALAVHRYIFLGAFIWAMTLETLAVITPFATLFALKNNYSALAIAYFGHVAYALPLGWATPKQQEAV